MGLGFSQVSAQQQFKLRLEGRNMELQKHPFYALHLRRPEEKKEELVRAASDKNLRLIFFLVRWRRW